MGVRSENILRLIKALDEKGFATHSIIVERSGSILAECYYEPFNKDFLHRMYSVSKSFVSMAVGLAKTEGLLLLDDKISDYFPEYIKKDEHIENTTIRDMLTMRSSVASYVPWWGKYDDRVESYFENTSSKLPGTQYFYDSAGSYLLGCIVEKLTGKTFLQYLKEKVLCKLGFSEESYTLFAPGGYTLGDSGVMCTCRDLLIFARFIMNLGEWEGKQYIDRDFMEEAVSVRADNNNFGGITNYNTCGYGYLLWMAPRGGFALVGMGDQLALCDRKSDMIFVINSDNQSIECATRTLIYHMFFDELAPSASDNAISENEIAHKALDEYCTGRRLGYMNPTVFPDFTESISEKKYILSENKMGISDISVKLSEKCGRLEFTKNGKIRIMNFGFGKNVFEDFPDDVRNLETAGEYGKGTYKCANSAAFTEPRKLVIRSQIIDTYFGMLHIHISFKDDGLTLFMQKSGQYILDDYSGYAIGKQEE